MQVLRLWLQNLGLGGLRKQIFIFISNKRPRVVHGQCSGKKNILTSSVARKEWVFNLWDFNHKLDEGLQQSLCGL